MWSKSICEIMKFYMRKLLIGERYGQTTCKRRKLLSTKNGTRANNGDEDDVINDRDTSAGYKPSAF